MEHEEIYIEVPPANEERVEKIDHTTGKHNISIYFTASIRIAYKINKIWRSYKYALLRFKLPTGR